MSMGEEYYRARKTIAINERKTIDMHVSFDGSALISTGWTEGDRRYHFWLTPDGTPKDDILHSNSTDMQVFDHKALHQTAKKWSPTIQAILAAIKDGDMINVAKGLREQFVKDAEERARKRWEDELLACFDKAVKTLSSHAMQTQLQYLSRAEKLAFITATQANMT